MNARASEAELPHADAHRVVDATLGVAQALQLSRVRNSRASRVKAEELARPIRRGPRMRPQARTSADSLEDAKQAISRLAKQLFMRKSTLTLLLIVHPSMESCEAEQKANKQVKSD